MSLNPLYTNKSSLLYNHTCILSSECMNSLLNTWCLILLTSSTFCFIVKVSKLSSLECSHKEDIKVWTLPKKVASTNMLLNCCYGYIRSTFVLWVPVFQVYICFMDILGLHLFYRYFRSTFILWIFQVYICLMDISALHLFYGYSKSTFVLWIFQVYIKMGMTEKELQDHFGGPAFLAWFVSGIFWSYILDIAYRVSIPAPSLTYFQTSFLM